MNPLFVFCNELFSWCEYQNIPLVLARPKFRPEDFLNTDLDVITENKYLLSIIQWITEQGLLITSQYQRSDGITCHIWDQANGYYFHIDFIDRLEIKGISYLSIGETLGRAVKNGGISYPDPVDQLIILLAVHGLKHQTGDALQRYIPYLQNTIRDASSATLERIQMVFSSAKGTMIYDDILAGKSPNIRYDDFILAAWVTHGMSVWGNFIAYHFNEMIRRYQMPIYRVAFLGVDGSGKSTLINAVKNQLNGSIAVIEHTRCIPAWPWHNEQDSTTILADPHRLAARGYLASVAKLLYFAIRYWIILMTPRKTPRLYLHDRYITDIAVDPKRYRYAGPRVLSWLGIFPKPEAYILVDISPETAWQRKQEVSQPELLRQTQAYRQLPQTINNMYAVNGELPVEGNTSFIQKIIHQVLQEKQ